MVCTKLFLFWKRFSLFVWTIEGKNFDVSVTYPQYYWKISITLRGCLEKFLTVRLLKLETFTVKLRILGKRKMPLYNKGTFDDGFYKVFKKKVTYNFSITVYKKEVWLLSSFLLLVFFLEFLYCSITKAGTYTHKSHLQINWYFR